jgi:putative ABC transport system permease protein
MRGAIVAFGPADHMIRVADLARIPDDAWALRGDRGLTFADALPERNVLTAGRWWPAGYRGEPLVSVDEKLAQAIHLKLGDRITVSLLGVERSAGSPRSGGSTGTAMASTMCWCSAPMRWPMRPTTWRQRSSWARTGQARDRARDPVRTGARAAVQLGDRGGAGAEPGAQHPGADGRGDLCRRQRGDPGGHGRAGRCHRRRARARPYDAVVLRVLGAGSAQLLLLVLAEQRCWRCLLAWPLALGTAGAWAVVTQLFDFAWLPGWGTILAVLAARWRWSWRWPWAVRSASCARGPAQALREL